MAQISQITNGNVYIDGRSQVGRAKKVTLGDITAVMNEIKALGMVGVIEAFAGFEKMEGSIEWNSFYPDVFRKAYNPMRTIPLMVRANHQEVSSAGIGKEESLVTHLNVTFKKNPLGAISPHEAAEFTSEISILSVVQKIGGVEILAFDPVNNIFRVNGEDMLARFRANT